MTLAERHAVKKSEREANDKPANGNFKTVCRAGRWGARIALVLGESEVADGTVSSEVCAPVSKR